MTGAAAFLWGGLCDPALLEIVLGQPADLRPAVLPDHAVRWNPDAAFPAVVSEPGSAVSGLVLRDAPPDILKRLDHFAAALRFIRREVVVEVEGLPVAAVAHFPAVVAQMAADRWRLTDWQAGIGATVIAAAGDIMDQFGTRSPDAVAGRLGSILARGGGRLRAKSSAPTAMRWHAATGDVVTASVREPYAQFFSVEEHDLSFRRFDGAMSPTVTRAAFVSGDAVTVLPYDAKRDLVLVIEQFRAGPHIRGDAQAWQVEAIAGRIDPGETPEAAVLREAHEEAGLTLGALLPVAAYYPSPGIMSEFLYSYVALTDLPDGAAGVFGLDGEAEDIRGHLIEFVDLMALVASGEVGNAPLILTALWLQRERPRLRELAGIL